MRLTTLASLALLAAMLAAALTALTAHAGPPPDNLELIFRVDDADGIIEPGQTVKVSAALRFPGQYGGAERMKPSNFSLRSNLGWETAAGGRLTIDNPTWANRGLTMGGTITKPYNANGVQLPANSITIVMAMDGRTAVARSVHNNLHIYDTWNKRQVLIIPTPAGATNSFGASERGYPPAGAPAPTGGFDPDRYYHGRAIAVWHETESLAWVFLGEPNWAGAGGATPLLGRLHIYTLDWSTDPPTFTATGTTLSPPLAEVGNHLMNASGAGWSYSNDYSRSWAAYGSAVSISADGSTLAVGAGRIHNTGAVYLYTRPDSEGDWADLAYEDGVKVTVAPVGHWGQSEATSTMPFSGQTCDAICIRQRAAPWSKFGWRNVALSADGRVLAVGAPGKQHYETATPAPWGGQGGGAKPNAGEAYVFVAPDGGWQTAPDVVTGKNVLTAKQPAPADYTRATHITPGPNRRITSPPTCCGPSPGPRSAPTRTSAWPSPSPATAPPSSPAPAPQ